MNWIEKRREGINSIDIALAFKVSRCCFGVAQLATLNRWYLVFGLLGPDWYKEALRDHGVRLALRRSAVPRGARLRFTSERASEERKMEIYRRQSCPHLGLP